MSFKKPDDEELARRFTAHALNDVQTECIRLIRATLLEAAIRIRDLTPLSAEQTKSLGFLEEAMFHATAAIARRE